MRGLLWMLILLGVAGCPRSVMQDFRDAKQAALDKPEDPQGRWQPDAVLHISHDVLERLVNRMLSDYGTLAGTLDATVATLRPRLSVKQVNLGKGDCPRCLGVGTKLAGTLKVGTAVGSTSVPATVDLAFDIVLDVESRQGEHLIQVQPRRLRDLNVTINGVGLGYARSTVQSWVDQSLLTDVPPQEVTTIGGDDFPVRAVKVVPVQDAVQIHVLTSAPDAASIPVPRVAPQGWRLDIAPRTLVAMAAAEAYRAGPVAHDVVPVPTSLGLQEDRFTLGLRLWRTKGRGWWRDYEVTGSVKVDGNKIVLTPRTPRKQASRPGLRLPTRWPRWAKGSFSRRSSEPLKPRSRRPIGISARGSERGSRSASSPEPARPSPSKAG